MARASRRIGPALAIAVDSTWRQESGRHGRLGATGRACRPGLTVVVKMIPSFSGDLIAILLGPATPDEYPQPRVGPTPEVIAA